VSKAKDSQEEDAGIFRFHPLAVAWNEFDSKSFDEWIMNVSEVYFRSGLDLRQAAKITNTRPAEVQAALKLAVLEETSLHVLAELKPAKTTWFLLAAADEEELMAAASVLINMPPNEPRPSILVSEAIREIQGPNSVEKVSGLSSQAFAYASEAAVAYEALSEKSQKALKNFARMKNTGKVLTTKQAIYAQDLLRQLVEQGVISNKQDSKYRGVALEIIEALEDAE
jgi:hypothetical protein